MKRKPKLTRRERVALTGKGPAKAHWKRGEVFAFARIAAPKKIAKGSALRGEEIK